MKADQQTEQQCVGKRDAASERCSNRSVPAEGYDFFLCAECMEEIIRLTELIGRYERHGRN